jgi:hypothetical protein
MWGWRMLESNDNELPVRRAPVQRRNSNPLFFPMIVLGGVMGLLAGYGVLTLLASRGIGPLKQPPAQASSELPTVDIEVPGFDLRSPPPADPKPKRNASRAARQQTRPQPVAAEEPAPPIMPPPAGKAFEPPPAGHAIAPANPAPANDGLPVQVEKPSALLTLTLEKPVLRAISEADSDARVHCDVGFSNNLVHRGDNVPGFAIVAANLSPRDKRTVELGANITGGGAAIEIAVLRRSNNVVCELRPLYSLPSGDIQPLTVTGGTRQHNELTRSLAAAKSARDALPELRSTLSQLQNELRDAQQAARGTSGGADSLPRQSQGMVLTTTLPPKIAQLSRKITAAEKLTAQESIIDTDLRCLDEISKYAESIASISTVSVRFHIGDKTIPATVK